MEWLDKILEYDTQLFLFLNGFYSDFWDTIMLMVTRKETWFIFYLILAFFFIKNYKNKAFLIIILLVLTVTISDQVSVILKENIQRLRPVHNPEIQHLVHNVLRKGGLYGFVSSHAANTFAIFIFSSRIFKQRSFWGLMLFWAILVSYSRIYSGVHYPLDIIGGAVLGGLIGLLMFKLLMFIENHFFIARSPKIEKTFLQREQSGIIFLVFIVLIVTILVMAYILHFYKFL